MQDYRAILVLVGSPMTLYERIHSKSIALLDPDPWIRGSLSFLFQCESCRLAAFDNIADGLLALQTQRFDIIMCDYAMGGEDGIAFLKQAGRIQPGAVRVLTGGYPLGEIAELAARAGIDGCLQKPFTLEGLERTLGGLIDDDAKVDGNSSGETVA